MFTYTDFPPTHTGSISETKYLSVAASAFL